MNVNHSTMKMSNAMYCKSQLNCEFAYRNLKIQHVIFGSSIIIFAHVSHSLLVGLLPLTTSLLIYIMQYKLIILTRV